MDTIATIGRRFAGTFALGERKDGSKFWSHPDSSDSPLGKLCYAAHQDGSDGGMLPDDWRYQMIRDALEAIGECDADADADEDAIRERLAAHETPIPTHELLAWLASRNDRLEYCDRAAEEYGSTFNDTLERIAAGWRCEWDEVSGIVLAELEKLAAAPVDA